MKLNLALLERVINVPQVLGLPEGARVDPQVLRRLFDDLGLEVKDIESVDDRVTYTIEILANRGDHFHALGVARELAARTLQGVKYPTLAPQLSDARTSVPVHRDTDKCLRYALLEMHVPTHMPLRADIASVLPSVDPDRPAIVHTLNYILFEMGQPMHAFDREKIEGEIRIVLSEKPEEVVALDGMSYTVPSGSLLIRDKKKTVAVAGVIGCANSMVTNETKRVLVESATFDPVTVRKTARAMGVSTDASFVFERGADIDAVVPALKRLAYLLAGGTSTDAAHVVGFSLLEGTPTEKRIVPLSMATVRQQMNLPRLPEAEVVGRLKHLGFGLEPLPREKPSDKDSRFKVTVPSWRLFDIRNEEDLVEEFARVHGLNSVKLELPPLDAETPPSHDLESLVRNLEGALHGNGFFEVITKSLISQDDVALIASRDPKRKSHHIGINNAIESSNSHLKVTNLLSLARLSEKNHRHGVLSFKVYEVGRLYHSEANTKARYEYERDTLSIAYSGRWYEGEWKGGQELDEQIALFRGMLESLFRSVGLSLHVDLGKDPLLHAGRQGTLKVGRRIVGNFGVIHPEIREKLECRQALIYSEIDLETLLDLKKERSFGVAVDLPSIRRDVTLRVGERDFAEQVVQLMYSANVPLLRSVRIVDDFKKPGESFRRTTYRMVFQSIERTLEHAEADTAVNSILSALKAAGFEMA